MRTRVIQNAVMRLTPSPYLREIPVGFGFVVLLLTAACSGQAPPTSKPGSSTGPRTWGEVQVEIERAFKACNACIDLVLEKRHPETAYGYSLHESLRPTTSYAEYVCKLHPHGRPQEEIVVLDIRIERDFSGPTGKASSFRLVRFVAKDEGQRMFAKMVDHFEKQKLPYDIIERKKDPNEKVFDPNNKPSGVF